MGSRAGALRQMLLDLLEDPHEIRLICIMGRNCTLKRGNDDVECSVPLEKLIAEGKLWWGFFLDICSDRCSKSPKGSLISVLISFSFFFDPRFLIWFDLVILQKRRKKLRCFWKIIFKGLSPLFHSWCISSMQLVCFQWPGRKANVLLKLL